MEKPRSSLLSRPLPGLSVSRAFSAASRCLSAVGTGMTSMLRSLARSVRPRGFVGGGEFDDGDGAGLQHVAVALGHRKAPVIYPVGLEYDPIDVIRPGPLLGEFHGRGRGLSVDEEQVGITRFQGIQHFEDCVAVGALIEGGEGYRRAGGQMCLMVGFRPGRGLPRGAGQFGGDPRLFPGLALSFLGGPNPLLFGDPRLFLFPALSFRGGPSPLLFGDPRQFPAFQLLGNPLRDVLRAAIDRARRGAGGALMGGQLRSRNVRLERLRFVPGSPQVAQPAVPSRRLFSPDRRLQFRQPEI